MGETIKNFKEYQKRNNGELYKGYYEKSDEELKGLLEEKRQRTLKWIL